MLPRCSWTSAWPRNRTMYSTSAVHPVYAVRDVVCSSMQHTWVGVHVVDTTMKRPMIPSCGSLTRLTLKLVYLDQVSGRHE